MAGNGPPPGKDKRRTNSTKLEQVNHVDFEVPELPKTYKTTVWVKGVAKSRTLSYTAETRAWWETWKRSPVTDEWAEIHWLRLLSVAKLKDRYERDPSPANATELRLQEAAFGGTPADLRRLGKIVKTAKPDTGADGPGAEVVDYDAERRRRLSGVATG